MKKVTLQIGEEEFAFAQWRAKQDGYSGPVDFLNGLLNMELVRWMDGSPRDSLSESMGHVIRVQDARIDVLKSMLLGSLKEIVRRELQYENINEDEDSDRRRGGGDLDDGIPF